MLRKTSVNKRCIIYVRVSTEEQVKGYSLDAQEETDTDFAVSQGYKVVKIFREEGLSAKNLNRPKLQEMMKWGREHKDEFEAIIFWKWDRISRGKEEDYAVLAKFFQDCNIRPLSVTECNEESPEGELLRWITKGMNLYELRKISQRTQLGMSRIAKTGRKPGSVPIGYLNYTNPDGSKTIIINEKEAPFVKKSFEMYASGNYSIEKIENFLFDEGIRNKRGGKYQKVEHMLKNIFYTGKFIWGKNIYEGTHTPIVSRILFDEVQTKFGLKKPKTHSLFFPYTNMIKCECCGKHYLSAEMKRGAHNSGEYIYYRCKCGCKAIKQEVLENTFAKMLSEIYIPPKEVELLKEGAKELLEAIKEYETKIETPIQIQEKIDKINERIKKAYKEKLDGNVPSCINENEWLNMIGEWAKEKDVLTIKLKERMEKSKILYNRLDLMVTFCNRLPEMFRLATSEKKREIIQTCVRTLTYNGKTLKIELFPVFEELRNSKKLINGADSGIRTHAYRNHNPRP